LAYLASLLLWFEYNHCCIDIYTEHLTSAYTDDNDSEEDFQSSWNPGLPVQCQDTDVVLSSLKPVLESTIVLFSEQTARRTRQSNHVLVIKDNGMASVLWLDDTLDCNYQLGTADLTHNQRVLPENDKSDYYIAAMSVNPSQVSYKCRLRVTTNVFLSLQPNHCTISNRSELLPNPSSSTNLVVTDQEPPPISPYVRPFFWPYGGD